MFGALHHRMRASSIRWGDIWRQQRIRICLHWGIICRHMQSREMCSWSTPWRYKKEKDLVLTSAGHYTQESGKFCGVARLSTESRRDGPKVRVVSESSLAMQIFVDGFRHVEVFLTSLNLIMIFFRCYLDFTMLHYSGVLASSPWLVCQGSRWGVPPWLDLQGGPQLPEGSAPVQPLERGQTCQDWKRRTGWRNAVCVSSLLRSIFSGDRA